MVMMVNVSRYYSAELLASMKKTKGIGGAHGYGGARGGFVSTHHHHHHHHHRQSCSSANPNAEMSTYFHVASLFACFTFLCNGVLAFALN